MVVPNHFFFGRQANGPITVGKSREGVKEKLAGFWTVIINTEVKTEYR